MDDALPRVADAAVHLDRGLAHRARGAGAVRLGDRGPAAHASSGGRLSTAHDACSATLERALHQAARLGEQVLHGLERTDRHAVLPALAPRTSTVTSSTPRITPTRSALVSARPSAVHAAEVVVA